MALQPEVHRRSYTPRSSQDYVTNDSSGSRLSPFGMSDHPHWYDTPTFVGNCSSNQQADLKPDNIMVKIEDPTILERDARDEYCNPLPQKVIDGRTIYLSRNNYGPFSVPAGIVQITDFGFSVSGTRPHSGCIQAEVYRAPEVVLDAGYTYSADIWSLGVMVCSNADDYLDFDLLMSHFGSCGTCLKERRCSIQLMCEKGMIMMTRRISVRCVLFSVHRPRVSLTVVGEPPCFTTMVGLSPIPLESC